MMEYEKCLVELDMVLNHLSKEDLKKIPEDILKGIRKKKDRDYIWKYDETKQLKDQQLNRRTIAMLSYLNMEYLLNDEQKKFMKKIHDLNEQKIERTKKEKYNIDNLFDNLKYNTKVNSMQTNSNNAILVVNEKKWYSKVFEFIKKSFKKNLFKDS